MVAKLAQTNIIPKQFYFLRKERHAKKLVEANL